MQIAPPPPPRGVAGGLNQLRQSAAAAGQHQQRFRMIKSVVDFLNVSQKCDALLVHAGLAALSRPPDEVPEEGVHCTVTGGHSEGDCSGGTGYRHKRVAQRGGFDQSVGGLTVCDLKRGWVGLACRPVWG